MTDRHPLYQAALDADNAFTAELEIVYGKDAGDARYDYAKFTATPQLADLAFAKVEADLAWLDWRDEQRRKSA
jgi:hypothetical protein